MKRFFKGFTLAEVLITLSIIGVVASLTLPTITSDTKRAQVGPKLGKAVSTFEQANSILMQEHGVSTIMGLDLLDLRGQDGAEDYIEALSDHLKISKYRGTVYTIDRDSTIGPIRMGGDSLNVRNAATWISKDGVVGWIAFAMAMDNTLRPNRTPLASLLFDINGPSGPNLPGTDVFAFRLMNDGSLLPAGSENWAGDMTWFTKCKNGETPETGFYYTCTASIFENGMKVMYNMR